MTSRATSEHKVHSGCITLRARAQGCSAAAACASAAAAAAVAISAGSTTSAITIRNRAASRANQGAIVWAPDVWSRNREAKAHIMLRRAASMALSMPTSRTTEAWKRTALATFRNSSGGALRSRLFSSTKIASCNDCDDSNASADQAHTKGTVGTSLGAAPAWVIAAASRQAWREASTAAAAAATTCPHEEKATAPPGKAPGSKRAAANPFRHCSARDNPWLSNSDSICPDQTWLGPSASSLHTDAASSFSEVLLTVAANWVLSGPRPPAFSRQARLRGDEHPAASLGCSAGWSLPEFFNFFATSRCSAACRRKLAALSSCAYNVEYSNFLPVRAGGIAGASTYNTTAATQRAMLIGKLPAFWEVACQSSQV
mmetsp:Transcript_86814/g.265747  ORF Transcript_86814/g.265747 Transcript_86814/m.265747 type:complete len:372 (-) Transcript_86814:567-1682(-)